MQKSHRPTKQHKCTQQNTPLKSWVFRLFFFFFFSHGFAVQRCSTTSFTQLLHFVAHTFFPPVLWMCGVSHSTLRGCGSVLSALLNAAERVQGHKEQRQSDINSILQYTTPCNRAPSAVGANGSFTENTALLNISVVKTEGFRSTLQSTEGVCGADPRTTSHCQSKEAK